MDVFDELSINTYDEQLQSLSTDMFSGSIDADGAITSDSFHLVYETEVQYTFPKNSEALRIWKECGLRNTEGEFTILRHLSKWAEAQKALQYDETQLTVIVRWKSPSGVLYNTSWPVFTKWFLCACA